MKVHFQGMGEGGGGVGREVHDFIMKVFVRDRGPLGEKSLENETAKKSLACENRKCWR